MSWVPWRPFQNEWNRRYIPSRGLLYSFLIHEIALFLCFTYSIVSLPKMNLKTPEQEIHDAELVYLPSVGGGHEGGDQGKSGREGEGAADDKATKKLGVTFRGPQYLKSNPKNPDNYIQTVLQPALVVAPKLNFPMQLPNMIRIAPPPKPVEVIEAKPNKPSLIAPPEPVLVAKADPQQLATTLRSEVDHLLTTPPLKAAEKPPVTPMPVAPEVQKPRPVPPVLSADAKIGDQSIAVLNAIQITAKPSVLPPGEKLGAFEVSPNGSARAGANTALGPGAPGGSPNGTSSTDNGISDKSGAMASAGGKGTGLTGSGTGAKGTGPGSSTIAGGTGGGSGKGSSGKGSGVVGRGLGNGSGGTKGGGAGGGNGAGAGAGNGSGAGPFSDIEVIGGEGSGFLGAGGATAVPKRAIPRGYDLNIIASAGSGGGLKDFGVFHNEAVYTVYMDVSDIIPGSRSWILQYADSGSTRTAEINLDAPAPTQSMLEPPYATELENTGAAAVPTGGTMTIVTGLISTEGRFQAGRVLQASNDDRGKQWLATLDKWRFHAASKGGKATTVRVVLGIPER